MTRKLLPQIVRLTPSSYADYTRCARLYYTGTLLGVPASDVSAGSQDQGLLVHEALEQIHLQGSCHDDATVDAVLTALGADTEPMRGFVSRHERRCPQHFERQAHEVDRVRLYRASKPMFLASARIDAIWIHDGVLDARDYKTGRRPDHALADDDRARVQAWVLAHDAIRTGLRLRLRYEYLQPEVDDDPEPWEPAADELTMIEDELRDAVTRMWKDEDWRGESAADVCGNCRYRSVCRDSAVRGEPSWAACNVGVDDDDR